MATDPEQPEQSEESGQSQLRRRLQSVDPALTAPPPTGLAADLARRTLERAMQETQQQDSHQDLPDATARRRWVPLAAAAAALVVGGTAYVATQVGEDGARPPATAAPTVTELALPESAPPGRCMQVNAQTLTNPDVVLEGTVLSVREGEVVLEVGEWFTGGAEDRVRLSVPDAASMALPLPGQPEFAVGERWLVTATDGRVNACGFTAPWSQGLAELVDQAFPD